MMHPSLQHAHPLPSSFILLQWPLTIFSISVVRVPCFSDQQYQLQSYSTYLSTLTPTMFISYKVIMDPAYKGTQYLFIFSNVLEMGQYSLQKYQCIMPNVSRYHNAALIFKTLECI